MANIPTFNGSLFSWKGNNGSSFLTDLSVPDFPTQGFYIRSQRTGETRLFFPNTEKMEKNEFYDGEAYDFFCPGEGLEVQIWRERM